jgi:glutathione S-transferase
MLKIYGRANSINVRKVLWALEELGLPYTREDWGRGYKPLADPDFERVNPFMVVPVLEDGDFVLRESNAIVRYLCGKQGRTDLYPAELQRRATVESWMDWGSTDLYRGVTPVFHGLITKMPGSEDPAKIATGIKEWSTQMGRLDAWLAVHGPYLLGATFTIADIPAGLVVNRWYAMPMNRPHLSHVQAYYDRLSLRRAFMLHGRNGMP